MHDFADIREFVSNVRMETIATIETEGSLSMQVLAKD